MEVSDANLQTLAGYLQQTLSPDVAVRKQGRIFIHVENYMLIIAFITHTCIKDIHWFKKNNVHPLLYQNTLSFLWCLFF